MTTTALPSAARAAKPKNKPTTKPESDSKTKTKTKTKGKSKSKSAAAQPADRQLLSGSDRHLVSRFSYGITPELARDVHRAGGSHAWFAHQLRPASVKDKQAGRLRSWWPSLHRGAAELWQRQITNVEPGWEVMNDYARWVLMRRMTSKRQLLEVMTEFWENHLHVAAVGDAQFTHRVDYGDQIRKHALGSFDKLLIATTTHPAMLIYLDAAESTKDHPNENLGRELLELHTVGAGHYTEHDVRDSARILTGWSVDSWETWRPVYNEDDHYRGKVKVKGFEAKNMKSNGKAVTSQYLRHLARHPDTARHIAAKLAVKFVGDNPSPALVRHLARVYLANDTAIVPVLQALVGSASFQRAKGSKVRDPGEDLVATYRVLGVSVRRPSDAEYRGSALESLVWQAGSIGVVPFTWGRPDGQPIDDDSWSSPARILASMRFHSSLAGGWPESATRYRNPKAWLPGNEARFDELVGHLSETILHRPATKGLVHACSVATGVGAHEVVDTEHDLIRWGFPRLLTTLLDSPTHLSR